MKLFALFSVAISTLVFANSAKAVVIMNGDFETDSNLFVAWPGYTGFTNDSGTNPDAITGWTGTGGIGINPVVPGGAGDSPFDGASNTSTGAFAFLQGTATLTQIVGGFSIGSNYVLTLDANARDCCGDFPVAEIKLDGNVVASSRDVFPDPGAIVPAGVDDPWYRFNIPFTATAESHEISFSTMTAAGGDGTLVVDNVAIVPEPSVALLSFVGLIFGLWRRPARASR